MTDQEDFVGDRSKWRKKSLDGMCRFLQRHHLRDAKTKLVAVVVGVVPIVEVLVLLGDDMLTVDGVGKPKVWCFLEILWFCGKPNLLREQVGDANFENLLPGLLPGLDVQTYEHRTTPKDTTCLGHLAEDVKMLVRHFHTLLPFGAVFAFEESAAAVEGQVGNIVGSAGTWGGRLFGDQYWGAVVWGGYEAHTVLDVS
jgi:hypothetical protein